MILKKTKIILEKNQIKSKIVRKNILNYLLVQIKIVAIITFLRPLFISRLLVLAVGFSFLRMRLQRCIVIAVRVRHVL